MWLEFEADKEYAAAAIHGWKGYLGASMLAVGLLERLGWIHMLIPSWAIVTIGVLLLVLAQYEAHIKVVKVKDEDIQRLNAELERMCSALKVDPREERQREMVRALLHDFTPAERDVLRYITSHGRIRRSSLPQQLSSCDPKLVDSALKKARDLDLLIIEYEQSSAERWVFVKSALEPALVSVLGEGIP